MSVDNVAVTSTDPLWKAGVGSGSSPVTSVEARIGDVVVGPADVGLPAVAGTPGQVLGVNTGGEVWLTMSGDATFSQTGALTVTKINGASPGAFFNGTDAANLTGTINNARLSAIPTATLATVSDGSNAAAGKIGEYVVSAVAYGTVGANLTSATALNLTSISLTAGDWEVEGVIYFNGAGTTNVNTLGASISASTNALDTSTPSRFTFDVFSNATTFAYNTPAVRVRSRVSISATTTIYLVAYGVFATSTCHTHGGELRARRVR